MWTKILVSTFLGLAIGTSCMALDENHYHEQYNEKVVPLIKAMGEGFFLGQNNVQIHYRTYLQTGAKNCMLILPGRTEAVEKYAEVVYDLTNSAAGKNINFYLMDHRGQGSSGRMKTPSDMGYVDNFKNYVLDMEQFTKNLDLESKCEKKFLLAHSLGAGISTAFLLAHPNYFQKVVFSSPMLKIMTKPFSYGVAKAIVKIETLAGRGGAFAIGQHGFNPNQKFEENTFTTSPVRFNMAMSIFENYSKSKLGGVANKWVLEIMKGTKPLRSRYHEISVPLKVFHAGKESYSEPAEMIKFCDEAINCQRTLFQTSKHEVLMDRDINRMAIIKSMSEFFN